MVLEVAETGIFVIFMKFPQKPVFTLKLTLMWNHDSHVKTTFLWKWWNFHWFRLTIVSFREKWRNGWFPCAKKWISQENSTSYWKFQEFPRKPWRFIILTAKVVFLPFKTYALGNGLHSAFVILPGNNKWGGRIGGIYAINLDLLKLTDIPLDLGGIILFPCFSAPGARTAMKPMV